MEQVKKPAHGNRETNFVGWVCEDELYDIRQAKLYSPRQYPLKIKDLAHICGVYCF